jgi:hypothetical protein
MDTDTTSRGPSKSNSTEMRFTPQSINAPPPAISLLKIQALPEWYFFTFSSVCTVIFTISSPHSEKRLYETTFINNRIRGMEFPLASNAKTKTEVKINNNTK